MTPRTPRVLPIVGWREWLSLPGFGVESIKAKIDTGARTSSLHVFDLRKFRREGADWVRFGIHPLQRNTAETVRAEAPVAEYRRVRSSTGQSDLRPVVVTTVALHGQEWPIEVTLANRDAMGFRMLLGRQAVRRRFLVDPGRSYYSDLSKRKRAKKKVRKVKKAKAVKKVKKKAPRIAGSGGRPE